MEYPIVIIPLSEEDGGGYLGQVPDLPGCLSDGETPEEATKNTVEAISDWLEECDRLGRDRPKPGNAQRAAREEHSTLVKTIHILSDRQDDLGTRIDDIDEKVENLHSWMRFADITGQISPKTQAPQTKTKHHN